MRAMTKAHDVLGRVHEWEQVLPSVLDRNEIAGGLRLTLDPGGPVGRIVELAVAEAARCSFLHFALTVDGRGVALEVAAPPEDRAVLYALFA